MIQECTILSVTPRVPRENNPVIKVSTSEEGVLDEWRVFGAKDYDNLAPNPKVVYLIPLYL